MQLIRALTFINKFLLSTLLLWPVAAFVSVFLFDSPGSESNSLTIGLAWSIWLYPIPVLFGSLVFLRYKERIAQKYLILLTCVSLSGSLVFIYFIWALEFYCQGKFACNPA